MSNEEAIKTQVNLLRGFYKIMVYPNRVECKCSECDLENYLFTLRNNLGYEPLFLTKLGIDMYHRASLIGFNSESGVQWFLVDPTYGQFFRNKKFSNYMFSNYKKFSLELLNNGYVECTIENIYSYLHGFMYSEAFNLNVDKDLVYNNIYNLLVKMHVLKNPNVSTGEKKEKIISKIFNRKKKSN